ncbi:MAG TPA: right-handed parallel beta-helix repeat-containing protein [Gemmatimonadaceae bacterium]|nr:right-handed parallel beta-helix repeat-containing protein [Gemmatimonadaceae bacterium]
MHPVSRALTGAFVLVLASGVAGAQRPADRAPLRSVVPRAGMIITTSVRIAPGRYELPAPGSLDSALLVVRGDDITIDFAGAELVGLDPESAPDLAAGVAIRIEGGRNVRVRNARIRGYKVAILARGTRQLELSGNDLSHNWKPRLFSLVEHESLMDWLSYHRNEQDEWLRFGAAVYLADVRGGEIRDNRVEQGMNGVMLVRSDSLRIWNNVIAFNSGVGIGLYRSSDNVIQHNHVDYNVRGYSHGFYRRGQDSAALLIYEQSSRNIVAYNSMTHGGDGLFLWAGQSTMDTGEGGANDNLFYGNDFSFAPTNGMEATFSRNAFVANRIEGSDHGLWGGYSWSSFVAGNEFLRNRIGIAIEHGQDNRITHNRFEGDTTAIRLWANPIEPSDWGYPKHRDTRSRDADVAHNDFVANRAALRATATSGLSVRENTFFAVDTPYALGDSMPEARLQDATLAPAPAHALALPPELARLAPPPIAGGLPRDSGFMARAPRSAIIVDEWGPYDYRSPKLWPVDSSRSTPLTLRVFGPGGAWRVVERRGVASLSRDSGQVGDIIVVTPASGSEGDWAVELEYRGEATVSPRGIARPAEDPVRFGYERFDPATTWTVRMFAWADSTDPRAHPESFDALLRGTPLLTRTERRLDYMWYRPVIAELPRERWALEATATVELPDGEFTLMTISDDAVRVWVDGRLVIDRWDAHGSEVDYAPLAGGRHALRVEYFQADGWTELRLDVLRGAPPASRGSPGPH